MEKKQKKKIVKHITKEYWENKCPLCGYTGSPIFLFFEEEMKIQIKVICPECDLTISYKIPRVQHQKLNERKKIDCPSPLPKIFYSC